MSEQDDLFVAPKQVTLGNIWHGPVKYRPVGEPRAIPYGCKVSVSIGDAQSSYITVDGQWWCDLEPVS